MKTKEQYEADEINRFKREMQSHNRKDTVEFTDFCLTMTPELINRISWILDGNYGHGALLVFDKMSKRMNRKAWLFNTLAALEFGCNSYAARKTWNSLSDTKQAEIDTAIDDLIYQHDNKLNV